MSYRLTTMGQSLASYVIQKQLERMLEDARSGKLRAMIVATVDARGEVATAAIGTPANIAKAREAAFEQAR